MILFTKHCIILFYQWFKDIKSLTHIVTSIKSSNRLYVTPPFLYWLEDTFLVLQCNSALLLSFQVLFLLLISIIFMSIPWQHLFQYFEIFSCWIWKSFFISEAKLLHITEMLYCQCHLSWTTNGQNDLINISVIYYFILMLNRNCGRNILNLVLRTVVQVNLSGGLSLSY